MRYALTYLLLMLCCHHSAYAGAWTQQSGDLYLADINQAYVSQQFFDNERNLQQQPTFLKLEKNIYAEYGLNNDLTLGANIFIHALAQENITSTSISPTLTLTSSRFVGNIGLADTELFARYALLHGAPIALSIQPLVKLPSYYLYDRLPKGGSDNFDLELSLLAGRSFELFGHSHYIDTRLGFRKRLDDALSDQIKADIKLGITVAPRWQIIPAAYMTFSTDMPSRPVFTESGQNDYDLLKLECNLMYKVRDNMDMFIGAFGHVDGKNTGQGYGFSVGTGLHF